MDNFEPQMVIMFTKERLKLSEN